MSLHPVLQGAADGRLPSWAEASSRRREHVTRVAELLDDWARTAGLDGQERTRWRAAGVLHDALRDADPGELRGRVPPMLRDLPPFVLHGPAAAAQLWGEGVRDAAVLNAVAWHTLGHPDLDGMGRAVYAADFLEPGRDLRNEWRATLRERFSTAADDVVREILGARIRHLLDGGRPVRRETVAFWNSMAQEEERR